MSLGENTGTGHSIITLATEYTASIIDSAEERRKLMTGYPKETQGGSETLGHEPINHVILPATARQDNVPLGRDLYF
jgi:hypothetical protein